MKIIFHENQLSYRGASVALFDYALCNQNILGNESVVVYQRDNSNNFNLQLSILYGIFNQFNPTNIKKYGLRLL